MTSPRTCNPKPARSGLILFFPQATQVMPTRLSIREGQDGQEGQEGQENKPSFPQVVEYSRKPPPLTNLSIFVLLVLLGFLVLLVPIFSRVYPKFGGVRGQGIAGSFEPVLYI